MQDSLLLPPDKSFGDPEQDMKLREDDKQWLAEEITNQINLALAEFKPHGWRRLVRVLRELGPIIGTCSIVLAVIAAAVTLGIFAFSGRIEDAKFRGTTEERLKNIESVLADIKKQLINQTLATHAAMPLADFRATLPDLRSALTAASEQKVKSSPQILNDLAQKLSVTDSNAPDYWPVTASMISYRSFTVVGGLKNWTIVMPSCPGTVDMLGADKNGSAQSVDRNGKPTGPKVPITRVGNQDCYVELDGKTVSKWDCTHCLVKYSGGPLSLTDVHFTDCLFVFDFRGKPAIPEGEQFAKAVLSSQSPSVRFPTA